MHHQDSWALVSSFRIPGELSCKLCIEVAICNRLRVYGHVFLLRTICNRHRHPRSSFLSSCHESPLVIIPYQYSKIKAKFPAVRGCSRFCTPGQPMLQTSEGAL